MGNCLLKFNDKPFNLHTLPLTSGHIKMVASGIRKNPVKYFARAYINDMCMKNLHKVLKAVLQIYFRYDFLANRVRWAS